MGPKWMRVYWRLTVWPLHKERLKEKDRNGIKYAFNFNGFNLDDANKAEANGIENETVSCAVRKMDGTAATSRIE